MRVSWPVLLLTAVFASADSTSVRAVGTDPQNDALFLMPTAFTPPRGTGSFRDFEIVVPTFGYAVTNSTVIRAGAMLPIFPNWIFVAGIKQQVWLGDDFRTAVAVAGNFFKPIGESVGGDDLGFGGHALFSRVFKVGSHQDGFALHAMAGYQWISSLNEEGEEGTPSYSEEVSKVSYLSWGLGTELRLGRTVKIIGEFVMESPLTAGEAGAGLITNGLRFHGKRASFDIGVMTSLLEEEYKDDSFVAPMINFGYRF